MAQHLRTGIGLPLRPFDPDQDEPLPGRPIPPRIGPAPSPNPQPQQSTIDPGRGGEPDPMRPPGTPDVLPPIPNPQPPIPYGPNTGIVPPGYDPRYGMPYVQEILQRPWVKLVGVGLLTLAIGVGIGYSIGRVRRL